MRIALIGATGRIGRRILAEATRRGHFTTAIARDPARIVAGPLVHPAAADILEPDAVVGLLNGADAVVNAYGPRNAASTDTDGAARARRLADHWGVPCANLPAMSVVHVVAALIPEDLARRLRAIVIEDGGATLRVAMKNPLDIFAVDEIRRLTGREVEVCIADERDVQAAIERWYRPPDAGASSRTNANLLPVTLAPSEPILVTAARAVIRGLRQTGVKRLLIVGGSGTLEVAPGVPYMDSPGFPAAWTPAAIEHRSAFAVYQTEAHDLDWTYLSPPALVQPGERTGKFRIGGDQLLTDTSGNSRVTAEDLAVAALDELESPKHIRQRFTVAY